MATMEMQVDEHTKRVLQESITTATQERENDRGSESESESERATKES